MNLKTGGDDRRASFGMTPGFVIHLIGRLADAENFMKGSTLLVNRLKVEGSRGHVILSEAKDLLKMIDHIRTRSLASLRITWNSLA